MFDIDLSFEMDGFDIDIGEKIDSRYITPKIPQEKDESMLSYKKAEELASDLTISPGFRHYIIVNGEFCMGDFIEAMFVKNNWHSKKLQIATLSLNENNVDSLENLLDGGFIDSLDIVVSAFFFAHERNRVMKYLYHSLDKENRLQVGVTRSHCKICQFRTDEGLSIIIHGSANLRSSWNLEQIVVEDNEMIYNFNNEFLDEIIKRYATIKKEVPVGDVWQKILTDRKGRSR